MMEQRQMQEILEKVLSIITPSREERARLMSISELMLERINQFAREYQIRGMLVGSAARDTWVAGEHDLDVFILFPEEVERKTLEETGLEIARRVLFDADWTEERYAEHPYLHGRLKDCEIDLVPCYDVRDPQNIKSAVDRTPHHNKFVKEHIKSLEGDVRLAKQFMKTAGIYGSELRTHGFSGYLTELLIIHYGCFTELLKAASNWKPNTVIDIKKHSTRRHSAPLVVVDPTDPKRNVAAALSLDNMCRFIDAARCFLQHPSMSFFFRPPLPSVSLREIEGTLRKRGTTLTGVTFERPDVVDDALYPQLEKMRASIERLLTLNDFRVANSGYLVFNQQVYLVFELFEAALPKIKKRIGPPVWLKSNAERFRAKYLDNPEALSTLYIEEGRYVIDLQRAHTTPQSLLEAELLKCGVGKHIMQTIEQRGFTVLSQQMLLSISKPAFRTFLYHLLIRKQPS
jgi:tRNA nucleotidyltransferase (CCA-adding enzyme)